MPDNIEEPVEMTEEPEPGPTPEEEEEWERQRKAAWEAKLAPFKAIREALDEHDELLSDALYEISLLETEE